MQLQQEESHCSKTLPSYKNEVTFN